MAADTATAGSDLAGDLWGGLASMLVALPASIAFGVASYAPLGEGSAAIGAIAGLLGATALGIVGPLFGGTPRLVTAPCAPAAAVMGALAAELTRTSPGAPARVVVLMTLVALLAGGLQIIYGLAGGGTLIKYIPYPVVTGYLSGVGVVIFLKQLGPLFGLHEARSVAVALADPGQWRWSALVVGLATIVGMVIASRLTRTIPAAIIGLAAGIAAYGVLALLDPSLRTLAGNTLVVGPLGGQAGGFEQAFRGRWSGLGAIRLADLSLVLMPAVTLSALLSIDTLKTCVLVDALTRSRHHSNREMIGQGLANLASAAVGGMPGAGTSGPTLVNLASGARTRRSGVLEGAFSLLAFLLLAPMVAWAPVAALAGVLIVVAFRMFDWSCFSLLRQRSTLLDFVVVASVITVAVTVGLISASAFGVALAMLLFVRDQVMGAVVHRKVYGHQVFSRRRRRPEDMAVLERDGHQTVLCELAGSLFFGTTDQLITALDADLRSRSVVILDLRRVRSIDLTAVHMLEQMHAQLEERGARLVLANVPRSLPTGRDLHAYLREVGLLQDASPIRLFNQASDALEWAEDRLLEAAGRREDEAEPALDVRSLDFLRGRKEETLRDLIAGATLSTWQAGAAIFSQGDQGDEIFLILRGRVRIVLRLQDGETFHVATLGRGDYFGDMAFLDRGETRSADALAEAETELLVLSREQFERVSDQHPRLAREFFAGMALSLARRLRRADREIRALREG